MIITQNGPAPAAPAAPRRVGLAHDFSSAGMQVLKQAAGLFSTTDRQRMAQAAAAIASAADPRTETRKWLTEIREVMAGVPVILDQLCAKDDGNLIPMFDLSEGIRWILDDLIDTVQCLSITAQYIPAHHRTLAGWTDELRAVGEDLQAFGADLSNVDGWTRLTDAFFPATSH
jgi:hypothetical protein